jgi:uncharacterized membrane protein YidH (DUF202 family)
MPAAASTSDRARWSPRALTGVVILWFVLALIGQWTFFTYIAAFYGGSLLDGNFEVWNRLQALGRTPYLQGDATGNWTFLAHALGAGLVAFGGVLQLMPAIRRHAPRFHRWNGRIFLVMVTVLTLSGFYLEWIRDEPPTTLSGYATSINGVLILAFACLAYRAARARNFTGHRQWAICLLLVANAQWFTRVGLFGYLAICQLLGLGTGSVGAFFEFWKFGAFLVPLAAAWLYLGAAHRGPAFKAGVATLIGALTLPMSIGMVAYGLFTFKLASGAPLGF